MKFFSLTWSAMAARLALCSAAISFSAMAQNAPPTADTFSLASKPAANFGAWPALAVTAQSSTFIKFNLSGLPSNANVQKAALRLYVDAVATPGSFDVYEINTPWGEGSLNFTNAPTPGQSATGSKPTSVSSSSMNQFVLIDVTTLVQDWVNGVIANNGIALKLTTPGGSFSFDSKESPLTSHEPELEITLADPGPQGPAGPQGPQGPQGPAGALAPGSQFYVQNGTATQTGASFHVDGTGTVGGTLTGNAVNSSIGFQINGITEFNANTTLGNLMLGKSAGNNSIKGASNQMIGDNAGLSLTTGNSDVFLGSNAGESTTTGNGDVYLGVASGQSATTAAYNTFLGAQTGPFTSTGGFNTFTGFNAGFSNTTGANNTYLGSQAAASATTANHNTFVGFNAGFNNTTGSSNLFLGDSTGANNTTGTNNIYLAHAGVGTENNTTRIGTNQTSAFIAGIYGASVSSGQPVFIDSTGHLGTGGGSVNVTGSVTGSTVNSTGGYQINGTTILNQDALNDTMIGKGAGNAAMTGGDSQFIGRSAGAAVTTGNADVFLGGAAGASTTTGNGDVYVGWASGSSATTAAFNTFLGAQTGFYNTGSGDLYLGFSAGENNTSGSNNVYLANGGVDGESQTIRIGGGQQAAFIAGVYGVTSGSGVPVYIDSNGQLGTLTSSQKYKEDVRNLGDVTSALMKLRPVTFYYKREYDTGERTLQFGLIAEEVARVFPELVAYNPDGTPYTVRYQYLSSILLGEVQKQYRRAQDQQELIDAQGQRIDALEQRLARIEMALAGERTGSPEGRHIHASLSKGLSSVGTEAGTQ